MRTTFYSLHRTVSHPKGGGAATLASGAFCPAIVPFSVVCAFLGLPSLHQGLSLRAADACFPFAEGEHPKSRTAATKVFGFFLFVGGLPRPPHLPRLLARMVPAWVRQGTTEALAYGRSPYYYSSICLIGCLNYSDVAWDRPKNTQRSVDFKSKLL